MSVLSTIDGFSISAIGDAKCRFTAHCLAPSHSTTGRSVKSSRVTELASQAANHVSLKDLKAAQMAHSHCVQKRSLAMGCIQGHVAAMSRFQHQHNNNKGAGGIEKEPAFSSALLLPLAVSAGHATNHGNNKTAARSALNAQGCTMCTTRPSGFRIPGLRV